MSKLLSTTTVVVSIQTQSGLHYSTLLHAHNKLHNTKKSQQFNGSFSQKLKVHQIIKGGWLLPLHVAIQYCTIPCFAHVGGQVAEARCVNVIDVDLPNHH